MSKDAAWIEGVSCTRNGIKIRVPDGLSSEILGLDTRVPWTKVVYWGADSYFKL